MLRTKNAAAVLELNRHSWSCRPSGLPRLGCSARIGKYFKENEVAFLITIYLRYSSLFSAKWRLTDELDPSVFAGKWCCTENADERFNTCGAREEMVEMEELDKFVENRFTVGSVVWAKMAGWPAWPVRRN